MGSNNGLDSVHLYLALSYDDSVREQHRAIVFGGGRHLCIKDLSFRVGLAMISDSDEESAYIIGRAIAGKAGVGIEPSQDSKGNLCDNGLMHTASEQLTTWTPCAKEAFLNVTKANQSSCMEICDAAVNSNNPTGSEGNCADRKPKEYCTLHKQACSINEALSKECPLTCGVCNATVNVNNTTISPTRPPCIDRADNCGHEAFEDYLDHYCKFDQVFKEYCMKTCGFCNNTLESTSMAPTTSVSNSSE